MNRPREIFSAQPRGPRTGASIMFIIGCKWAGSGSGACEAGCPARLSDWHGWTPWPPALTFLRFFVSSFLPGLLRPSTPVGAGPPVVVRCGHGVEGKERRGWWPPSDLVSPSPMRADTATTVLYTTLSHLCLFSLFLLAHRRTRIVTLSVS